MKQAEDEEYKCFEEADAWSSDDDATCKKETGANHVPVEFSWVNGRLV